MIGWLRSRLETRAGATPSDYTSLRIAESTAQVSGAGGVRSTAAFAACTRIIERAASIAEVEGEWAESLRPHLGRIAGLLSDCGEATYEIQLTGDGGLVLLPATIATVSGGAAPSDWTYLLTRTGPTESTSIRRPAAAVLSFRHPHPLRPWRGRGALESAANSTGALPAELEVQLGRESKVRPTRIITGGGVKQQAGEIEESIKRGEIVTLIQGQITGRDDPSGVRAGAIRNETTAAVVSLHEQLERAVCGALGVPAGLVLSDGVGASARENFRRFAAATIAPILTIIEQEWREKVGELSWNLDVLRASDQTAISRAIGSRANAVSRLVDSGVPLNEALSLAGID